MNNPYDQTRARRAPINRHRTFMDDCFDTPVAGTAPEATVKLTTQKPTNQAWLTLPKFKHPTFMDAYFALRRTGSKE